HTVPVDGYCASGTVPPGGTPHPPPARKKLSPIVEVDAAGTVRARLSKVMRPRSGTQLIAGGASTAGPGAIWKSTLLSWKPRPDTGAAYHQVRSQAFHP